MNRDDIIKMAQEADLGHAGMECVGFGGGLCSITTLERFAALVADRCAEIAYEAEPFHSADLIRKAFGVEK